MVFTYIIFSWTRNGIQDADEYGNIQRCSDNVIIKLQKKIMSMLCKNGDFSSGNKKWQREWGLC